MIFRVTGADSKTGADRTIHVKANDEQEAVPLAKERGVYPYQIERDLAAERDEEEQNLRASNEEAIKRQNANIERQNAELEESIKRRVENIKSIMRQNLEAQQPVFLYDHIYIPVDSILLEEPLNKGFDLGALRVLGIGGWDIVQAVPKTVGIGLQNSSVGSISGTTWGGGSGGNVVGVYLILKRQIKIEDLDGAFGMEEYIRSNIDNFSLVGA